MDFEHTIYTKIKKTNKHGRMPQNVYEKVQMGGRRETYPSGEKKNTMRWMCFR